MSLIDSTRPLYALSEGEFFQHLEEFFKSNLSGTLRDRTSTDPDATAGKRFVYGITGIERALGVSHKTAQRLKDGILAPAVKQRGRKIITDLDLALQLFDEKKGGK